MTKRRELETWEKNLKEGMIKFYGEGMATVKKEGEEIPHVKTAKRHDKTRWFEIELTESEFHLLVDSLICPSGGTVKHERAILADLVERLGDW